MSDIELGNGESFCIREQKFEISDWIAGTKPALL